MREVANIRDASRRRVSELVLVLLTLALVCGISATVGASESVAETVGPDRCGECHKLELPTWKSSRHELGYRSMHRSALAVALKQKRGIKRIKRDPICMSCHYTTIAASGVQKAVAGVSCESCHGAAGQWLESHGDYGGPDATRATESPAHREQRRESNRASGMRTRADVYELAQRCYACHVVADSQLVADGHPMGRSLELAAATQGEVRHNYFFSPDHRNRAATPEHLRILYVVGRLLELEHALRALTAAPSASELGTAAKARVDATLGQLRAVADHAPGLSLNTVVEALEAAWSTSEKSRLDEVIEIVQQAGRSAARHDGALLATVDHLLPRATVVDDTDDR